MPAVSRASAQTWLKMVASLEEVIQEVQDSYDDEMSSEIGEREREKDKDKLGNWLKNFPGNSWFNQALFKDVRREVLRPLIQKCSSSTEYALSLERSKGKMPNSLVFLISTVR